MIDIQFQTTPADECLTCMGKGWVTVQADPLIRETCPACLTGYEYGSGLN